MARPAARDRPGKCGSLGQNVGQHRRRGACCIRSLRCPYFRRTMPDLGEDRRGSLIGRGRTAEVYVWGDQQALKLFHVALSESRVARESQVAAVLSELAVPAPRFDGAIEVAGRRGLLFERVGGPTMLALLVRRPWLVMRLAQRLADLHVRIHHQAGSDLPPQRTIWRGRSPPHLAFRQTCVRRRSSACPAFQRETVSATAISNPDNVILTGRGPVVIDWNQSDYRATRTDPSPVLRTGVLASIPRSLWPRSNRPCRVATTDSRGPPWGGSHGRRAATRVGASQS
jgi:hypothetical protein